MLNFVLVIPIKWCLLPFYIVKTFTQSKARQIRPLLSLLGWNRSVLALKAGMSPRVLSNVIAGNNQGRKSREAIESTLGVSLWPDSSPSTAKPRPLKTSGTTKNPTA
jgi:hypothetical protein